MKHAWKRLGLNSEPKRDTLAGRIYAVALDLNQAGIAAHLDLGKALTRGDAWCAAEEATPATMTTVSCWLDEARWWTPNELRYVDHHARGTSTFPVEQLHWAFPYDSRETAEALVETFRRYGVEVSWDDEQEYGRYRFNVCVRTGA